MDGGKKSEENATNQLRMQSLEVAKLYHINKMRAHSTSCICLDVAQIQYNILIRKVFTYNQGYK